VEDKPKIMPLVWLLFALLLMAGLHSGLPLIRILHSPWTWAGLAPGVFGTWVMVTSARAFQRAETGLMPFDEATVLVKGGFFRYTRNPMYLGMVLILLGAAMLCGTAGAFLPIPMFVFIIRRNFILGEENFMEEAFGDEYLDYKRSVGRWL
jgi:protein-S-isoprenylcysteine O-methyltransferase Ste14